MSSSLSGQAALRSMNSITSSKSDAASTSRD